VPIHKRHLSAQSGVFALLSTECRFSSRKAQPLALSSEQRAMQTEFDSVLLLSTPLRLMRPDNTKYLSYEKFQPHKNAHKLPIKIGYKFSGDDGFAELKHGFAGGCTGCPQENRFIMFFYDQGKSFGTCFIEQLVHISIWSIVAPSLEKGP